MKMKQYTSLKKTLAWGILLGMPLPLVGCNRVTPSKTADGGPRDEIQTDSSEASKPILANEDSDDGSLASQSMTSPGDSQPTLPEYVPPRDEAIQIDSSPQLDFAGSGGQPGAVLLSDSAPEIESRLFATILPSKSTQPTELIEHIGDVDRALQELVLFGSQELIDQEIYVEGGRRLGKMKLFAAEKIIASESATDQQLKIGRVAKLVALSHLGGLQDAQSAQQLNEFARELSQSDDPDLEHQGRVVLLGFEVQSLQNGLTQEPANLVVACEQLLKTPEYRNFPELMAVQNAASVLHQMDFQEATFATLDVIAEAYQASSDKNLRDRAWAFAIGSRPVAQQFYSTMRALDQGDGTAADVAAAAEQLIQEHPLDSTAEQLAFTVGNIEAAGYIDASQRLAEIVATSLDKETMADSQRKGIQELLAAHTQRMDLIGKPFTPQDALTFAGDSFDVSTLKGKVVLVEFWASENIPSREELTKLANEYSQLEPLGFEVVALSLDENLAAAQQFLDNANLPWINLRSADQSRLGAASAYAQQFGVNQVPFAFLVDPSGKIAKLHVRAANLREAVEQLLK